MRRGTEERTGASMAAVAANEAEKKYKGVRRRKWGKWVSEIRVPGSQERLWLGSYATPEAAAVAHDVAFYCLRRPISLDGLNFPLMLPGSLHANMSPRSVQKAASDAGMGVDAQMIANKPSNNQVEMDVSSVIQGLESQFWEDESSCTSGGYGINWEENELSISVEDYLK